MNNRFLTCRSCGQKCEYPALGARWSSDGQYWEKTLSGVKKDRVTCGCGGCLFDFHNEGEVDLKSVSLGKFSMLSSEGKRAVLKKRASQHYKKQVKSAADDMRNSNEMP